MHTCIRYVHRSCPFPQGVFQWLTTEAEDGEDRQYVVMGDEVSRLGHASIAASVTCPQTPQHFVYASPVRPGQESEVEKRHSLIPADDYSFQLTAECFSWWVFMCINEQPVLQGISYDWTVGCYKNVFKWNVALKEEKKLLWLNFNWTLVGGVEHYNRTRNNMYSFIVCVFFQILVLFGGIKIWIDAKTFDFASFFGRICKIKNLSEFWEHENN